MKLRTARTILFGAFGAVILFVLLLAITQNDIFIYFLAAACVVYLIIYFLYLKCPNCRKNLHIYLLLTRANRCPYCGRDLDL